MTTDVKNFIEKEITAIDQEAWEYIYETAYDWLSDDQTKELTKVLEDTLNISLQQIALENALNHFRVECMNFIIDQLPFLSLPSFIRLYMNHTNGIDIKTFRSAIPEYLQSYPVKNIFIEIDEDDNELYIHRVRDF